jgi:hypothetical protein
VFQLCCEKDFDVIAKWIPREDLMEADEMSRRPDPSDWGISKTELEGVCDHFGVRPTVDLFASDAHHVTRAFVSQFYTPGCIAVDALHHDWDRLIEPDGIAWVFPPVRHVSIAISLKGKYRKDVLICLPIKAGTNELIQLFNMQAKSISEPLSIPREQANCIPSCRVPKASLNPAFLSLGIVRVQW